MKTVTKKEMKTIFSKHGLNLGFPCNSTNGSIITDWNYWYHYTNYENSDLKKFKQIIESEHSDTYKPFSCFTGGSIGIERIG